MCYQNFNAIRQDVLIVFLKYFEVCNNTSDIFVFLPRLVQKCQKEQIQTLRNLI